MPKKHVLLIDDNDIDNYISNHIIAKSDIAKKITIKSSAIEALEFLETVKNNFEVFPDIIFLDVAMPLMDGFGFLEEAVKFQKVRDNQCFVVMLTSSNNQDDIDRALKYSAVREYFTKPLKLEKLDIFRD